MPEAGSTLSNRSVLHRRVLLGSQRLQRPACRLKLRCHPQWVACPMTTLRTCQTWTTTESPGDVRVWAVFAVCMLVLASLHAWWVRRSSPASLHFREGAGTDRDHAIRLPLTIRRRPIRSEATGRVQAPAGLQGEVQVQTRGLKSPRRSRSRAWSWAWAVTCPRAWRWGRRRAPSAWLCGQPWLRWFRRWRRRRWAARVWSICVGVGIGIGVVGVVGAGSARICARLHGPNSSGCARTGAAASSSGQAAVVTAAECIPPLP